MRVCVQDMVVEYVSAVVAAGMQFFWAPTGLFMLGISAADARSKLTTAWLVRVLLIQLAPELVADAWCVWLETKAGLQRQVTRFWEMQFADGSQLVLKACVVVLLVGVLPVVLLRTV